MIGASLRKGWYRLIGAVAVVVLTACFPQDRAPFLVGLALVGRGLRSRRHSSEELCHLLGGANDCSLRFDRNSSGG
jgi:hypothetical protein